MRLLFTLLLLLFTLQVSAQTPKRKAIYRKNGMAIAAPVMIYTAGVLNSRSGITPACLVAETDCGLEARVRSLRHSIDLIADSSKYAKPLILKEVVVHSGYARQLLQQSCGGGCVTIKNVHRWAYYLPYIRTVDIVAALTGGYQQQLGADVHFFGGR